MSGGLPAAEPPPSVSSHARCHPCARPIVSTPPGIYPVHRCDRPGHDPLQDQPGQIRWQTRQAPLSRNGLPRSQASRGPRRIAGDAPPHQSHHPRTSPPHGAPPRPPWWWARCPVDELSTARPDDCFLQVPGLLLRHQGGEGTYCPHLGGLKPSPSGDSFSRDCGKLPVWTTAMAPTPCSRSTCTSSGPRSIASRS